MINKKKIDDPDDDAYRTLDQFLEAGVKIVKLWSARAAANAAYSSMRGGWRHCDERGKAACGSSWSTSAIPMSGGRTLIKTLPSSEPRRTNTSHLTDGRTVPGIRLDWRTHEGEIEHPDHLEAMLERCPNLYFDTSTKWQVREVSPRGEAIRSLITRHPTRFLFGSDLVTRHKLTHEHFVSDTGVNVHSGKAPGLAKAQ